MRIDALDSLVVILTVAAVTFMTRAAPFALQRRLMARRDWVAYLGKALPPAIMALLVVYSLRRPARVHRPVCGGGAARLEAQRADKHTVRHRGLHGAGSAYLHRRLTDGLIKARIPGKLCS